MRKFYLPAVCSLIFGLMVGVSKAQIYTTVPGGGPISANATWVGGAAGSPPIPCNTCQIIITAPGPVTIDIPVQLTNSVITIKGGATLEVSAFVQLFASSVIVGNNAIVNINDEVHLYTAGGVTSSVRLANTGSNINTQNLTAHPSTGTIDPGNFDAAGLYYITSGDNPVIATTQFDAVLTNTGIGGPFTPPLNPVPGAAFEQQYNINCDFGMPTVFCTNGFVWGPADMQHVALPPVPPPISPGVCWNFVQAAVLPVTLAQFDASLTADKTVRVTWATAEEINADYFLVERSADGSHWQSIGKVVAKGQSSGNVDYAFIDPAPLNALNFYRLKMVDRDAKFKYSKTATVSLDGKSAALVVYNNPFNDQIRIKVNSTTVDNLSLTLTDMLGRTYSHQFFSAGAGDNFINLTPTGASPGLYILNIKGKNINQTVKLVKE